MTAARLVYDGDQVRSSPQLRHQRIRGLAAARPLEAEGARESDRREYARAAQLPRQLQQLRSPTDYLWSAPMFAFALLDRWPL